MRPALLAVNQAQLRHHFTILSQSAYNCRQQSTNRPRYTHDALGNTTQAGLSTPIYSFDAENRLVKVSTGSYCYVYDGNGVRVAKKSGANSDCTGGTIVKLYWRGLSGDTLAETDATGSTTNSAYVEYVFFAGRRIAARGGTGAIFYYFADQLGTTRTITTGNGPGQTSGQLCYDADYTPYGQEMQHTERLQAAACPPNYRFTGYELDSETGLYYAFARYYSPLLGRFLSTDPLGGSIGNLQSHNAYAYVVNNPTNLMDPSGLGPKKNPHPVGPYGGHRRPPVAARHATGCTNMQTLMSGSGPSGCGYADDTCYVDGASSNCGVALALLASDAAIAVDFDGYGMNWTTNGTREDGYYGSGLLDLLLFRGDEGSMALKVTKDCFDRSQGTRTINYQLINAPGGSDNYTVAEQLSDPNFEGSQEVGGFHDDLRPTLFGRVGATTTNTQYLLVYPTAKGMNSAQWVPIIPMSGSPFKFNTITMTNGANPSQNIIKVNGKLVPDC